MSSQYKRCDGWIDSASCNDETSVLYPLNEYSSCSEIIGKERSGNCMCHNGQIGIGLPCDHRPMTCDYVCKKAIVGCEDPANQLAERFFNGDVVACDGMWNEPGLDAAEEGLCDADKGFHICADDMELRELGMPAGDCQSKVEANTFYLVDFGVQSMIYGCGNNQGYDQLPVTTSSITAFSPLSMLMDERRMKYFDGPWKQKGNPAVDLKDRVYKDEMSGGGILCCRDTRFDWDLHGDWRNVGALILELLPGIFLISLGAWCVWQIMKGVVRLLSPHIRCCQRFREWDGIIKIGGHKIALSRKGRRKIRQNREIDALESGRFRDFQNPNGRRESVISDESGACIICWEEYEAKSKVLRLNCGHRMYPL